MSRRSVLELIGQDIVEVFPIWEDAFGVDVEEFLEPQDIVVTTASDSRVKSPNTGEHLMDSFFDGQNYYLIL